MPHLLYLSHCVPNPPDKGERIRAFHELAHLCSRYRVHLVCFARSAAEWVRARELESRCESVYVERMAPRWALTRAAVSFVMGGCINTSFYRSVRLREHVRALARLPLAATVAYSTPMAQFAPPGVPLLLDMVDLDSEKWFQYASLRRAGRLYGLEARRYRRVELDVSRRAVCSVFATAHERDLFGAVAPACPVAAVENGVDTEFFDPRTSPPPAALAGRRILVFVGMMDYYPNVDAAVWFAHSVLPDLRRRDPALEFLVVGRRPAPAVRKLARMEGITVTGEVPDVRPYLAAAGAMVAPLRVARGVQNKVLEALAMGKPVLASEPVCATFGEDLPPGVTRCASAADFVEAALLSGSPGTWDAGIRAGACARFSWHANMERFAELVAAAPAHRSVRS